MQTTTRKYSQNATNVEDRISISSTTTTDNYSTEGRTGNFHLRIYGSDAFCRARDQGWYVVGAALPDPEPLS